jgi:hypothetical protein
MRATIDRRHVLLALAASLGAADARRVFAGTALPAMAAYRNPGCGCCGNWAKLMKQAGFNITMLDDADLQARRTALGVPPSLAGCHLAQIESYIIEGHVPVEDILKLLRERPAARGLAVPGMPSGSPGMEGGEAEKYDVLIFSADGGSKIYSSH